MNKIKNFICLFLALLFLPTVSASAAGSIDMNSALSLTISYVDGATPISGAEFSVYKIADAEATGELSVNAAFKGYGVEGLINDDASWSILASTLESFVLKDGVSPLYTGTTDADGKLIFPPEGKELTPGLYLIVGARHELNGNYYDPAPFVVMLPAYDSGSDAWLYDVTANVKFDRVPADTESVARKVIKVWDDKGAENSRPKEIKVSLLRDGEVYETVTLNAENNWRYEWTALDASFSWRVCEDSVPDGYTSTVTQEGTTFIVTNTAENPGQDTPDSPDTPDNPGTSDEPKLPQTGQLWWPVPVLAAAGLLLVLSGLLLKKNQNE